MNWLKNFWRLSSLTNITRLLIRWTKTIHYNYISITKFGNGHAGVWSEIFLKPSSSIPRRYWKEIHTKESITKLYQNNLFKVHFTVTTDNKTDSSQSKCSKAWVIPPVHWLSNLTRFLKQCCQIQTEGAKTYSKRSNPVMKNTVDNLVEHL